jgi:UDP-N-acetylmuramate dehydrogenase
MNEPLFSAESSAAVYLSPHEKIYRIIERCQNEYPCDAAIRYNEPMAAHTTFRVGGPADCWIQPQGSGFTAFAAALIRLGQAENIPFFILGGGANVVIADRGIRGIVLDTAGRSGGFLAEGGMAFYSGTALDEAAETAAAAGFSGLEFLAGMPGSIGGAVWMNARCYGREIADVLRSVEILDFSPGGGEGALTPLMLPFERRAFGYKKSPFQGRDCVILSAACTLQSGNEQEIRAAMEAHRQDREAKGHYRFPSAGSAFKNNHDFARPTGQIIDALGLRGLQIGGAQVAPFHGNIIINTGNAKAADIRLLVNEVTGRVKAEAGLTLEPEILFAGDW